MRSSVQAVDYAIDNVRAAVPAHDTAAQPGVLDAGQTPRRKSRPVPTRVRAGGHSERLVARARRGDSDARAAVVDEHMSIVRAVAFRYRGLGIPVEDLVQEGAIGLLYAIDNYDPSRGASFSTYAFWRVRAAITHSVTARANLVRVPRTVIQQRREVAAAHGVLSTAGHAFSTRDLSVATALTPDQVAEALARPSIVSLDESLLRGDRHADRLADDPAGRPHALAVAALETRTLRDALGRLKPRMQTILKRHFGIDREPEGITTIAADLRLSPARTRALRDEALRVLAADLVSVA